MIIVTWWVITPATADAQVQGTRVRPARTTTGAIDRDGGRRLTRPVRTLDGTYVMLGPLGSASYGDRAWQSAFGAQLLLVHVKEQAALSSLGGSIGGIRMADAERGRVWGDALMGTRVLGIHVGASLGATALLDRTVHPRWGAHATVWVFAGIVPYVRAGWVQRTGSFVELGLQVMLPAMRM